jgi:2-polyprenyl-3-methyl-5-hydroxy-6-metoxy-1,4-benzoquinol methylase
MNPLIKRGVLSLCNFIPYSLGRRLFRGWLVAIGRKEPNVAMKALLNLDDDLAGHLDQVAMRYDHNGIHVKHRLMGYHDFFVERVKPGERVLDIGCGYGALAWSMVKRSGARVTGIDLNSENIEKARRLYSDENLRFILGDALKALSLGEFETIVISNVLEHVDDRLEFIEKIQKGAHPKRWLIRAPMINRHWHVPLRKELGLFYFSDKTHCTEYTEQTFREEMEAAGLSLSHLQINWGEIWAEAVPKT